MGRMDSDLHLGQIAVRMGVVAPQELPRMIREARALPRGRGNRAAALGQVLLRHKRIGVSDYLHMARQMHVERDQSGLVELDDLQQAFVRLASGELDPSSFDEMLSRSAEAVPLVRPTGGPTRFGPYELLGEVARGGMGIVYRARGTSADVVALKVMIEAEEEDEVRLKRFEHEAELAAALDHPNIVRIHDAGRIDGMPYYTMDLIEGQSLDDMLEGQGLDRNLALSALAQVAHALDHAHERGIVHRDIKPGNVIIDAEGQAHITDFGLARDLARMTRLTQVGQAVGTPYYMAPEQVRGERDVDGRADIYAVGVMLYEILTGDVPFDADSPLSLFKKIDREPVVLEVDPARGIDEGIRAIVMRALAKERGQRYARGRLLAEDLERYLRGQAPRARAGGEASPHGLPRMTLVALLLVPLAVIILSIAGLMAWRRAESQRLAREGREQARAILARADQAGQEATRELEAGGAAAEALEAATRGLAALGELEVLLAAGGPGGRAAGEAVQAAGGPTLRAALLRSQALAQVELAAADPGRWAEAASASLTQARAADSRDVSLPLAEAQLRLQGGDAAGSRRALDSALELDPARFDALLQRGRLRLLGGDPEGAAADLSLALEQRQGQVEALVCRSAAYRTMGRLDPAAQDAEDARAAGPKRPEPCFAAGDVALDRGDWRQARELYREGEGLAGPDDPRGALRLAEGALARGSYEEALAEVERALSRAGGWRAYRLRALARLRLLELAEAEAALDAAEAALEQPAGSAELLQSDLGWALAATPPGRARASAELLVHRGELALLLGDAARARAAFAAARQADPGCELARVWLARLALTSQPPDVAGAAAALGAPAEGEGAALRTARGELAFAEGKLQAARELLERAVADAPQDPRARAALARARLALEPKGDAARAACQAAWTQAAAGEGLAAELLRRGEGLLGLAAAAGQGPLLREGHGFLEAALALNPGCARAWSDLGELQLLAQRPEEALRALARARAMDPFQARLLTPWVEAALLSEVPHELEGAVRVVSEALEEEEDPALLLLRARCRLALGAWAEGLADLDRAAERAPGLEVEPLRARALERLGQAAEAAGARERAAEQERARAARWEQLGAQARALAEAGQREQARALLLDGASLGDPDREPALAALLLEGARLGDEPGEALKAVRPLALVGDPALVAQLDAALAEAWTAGPSRRELRQELLRSATQGGAEDATLLALAASYDAQLEAAPEWQDEGLRRAEQAVLLRPRALAAHLARAVLLATGEDPRRALRELTSLRLAAPDLALLDWVEALALAASGKLGPSREALLRAQARGLAGYAERLRRARLLR